VACRETGEKRALVRVVRSPQGSVSVDRTGKANGRGAYVHDSPECWHVAITKDKLGHALKVSIAPADREALERHAAAHASVEEQSASTT
jgi:uncharacterized protein